MARWQKKGSDLDRTDQIIRQQPGIRPAEVADELGVSRSTITRRLPTMEEAGYLYSEDDRGGLWPFEPKQ
jgi:DNA-binding IclR family transcriptional regulator